MSRLRSLAASHALATALPVGAMGSPARAAGSITAAVSLTAPATGPYGTAITLQGRLWRYGTPYGIARGKVWLQRTPHGRAGWASISSAATASTGSYVFRVTQTGAYDYRVYYGGSAAFRAAMSPVRYPVTSQQVLFDSVATTNASTGSLRAAGRVYPTPPNGQLVHLQRWDRGAGVWHGIGSGRTNSGRVTVTATRPGSIDAYRLVVAARSSYGAGVSATRSLAHYVWRGAFARGGVVYSGLGGKVVVLTPAENPRRDSAYLYISPNTAGFEVAVDPSGCRQIATSSRWDSGNGQLDLRLYDSSKVLDTAALSVNQTVGMSGVHDPADPRIFLSIANPYTGGAEVTTRMALLCTN